VIPCVYVLPTIQLGYTFGAGITYGFNISVSTLQITKIKKLPIDIGLSFSYYWVNFDNPHSIKTLNFFASCQYADIHFGAGDVNKHWGFKGRNRDNVIGYNLDISASPYSDQAPWLGIKKLMLEDEESWDWFPAKNYTSPYLYFKHQKIFIFY